ncbi:hypothetical protein [Terrabacter terrigena]|uniref:Uncharacterized protein n=1 Tax=Terrabacter terrigena TaxID=574718 RepID=A0ABW3MVF9_9MICO
MPTFRARPGRMPSRAVVVAPAVLLAAAALVAACGTDTPSSRPTVTVFVDPPAKAAATTPAPARTSVPTVAAQPTTAAVPTALAVGRQRNAPHSYAEARARIESASPASPVTSTFQSPSGNIVCHLGGARGLAACEVRSGRVGLPTTSICPPGGPTDIGRVELRASGARPVCNADTIRDGGEPKLSYGSRTAALDPVACVSEESGVTCVDSSSRRGFFLARGTFVTF